MTTPTIEHVDLLTLRNRPTGFKMWQVVDERGVPAMRDRREDAELLFMNAMERYQCLPADFKLTPLPDCEKA